MTYQEYLAYQKAVSHFLEINKCKPGLNGQVEEDSEPFFSWSPCGCCNRPLGGNREIYSFVTESGDIQEDICTDCVYYLAYDKLNDETMMEIEKDQEETSIRLAKALDALVSKKLEVDYE